MMSVVSCKKASATWIKLMPFEAFAEAWFKPRIWLLIFSETARPEASSPARLMRKPDESFSMSLPMCTLVTPCVLCANIALML